VSAEGPRFRFVPAPENKKSRGRRIFLLYLRSGKTSRRQSSKKGWGRIQGEPGPRWFEGGGRFLIKGGTGVGGGGGWGGAGREEGFSGGLRARQLTDVDTGEGVGRTWEGGDK